MKFERVLDNVFGGHISIGHVTVFGRNAMHWGVSVWTDRYGFVCFRLPLRCFGRWWPLYFYCSPNATPMASTFYVGGSKLEGKWNRKAAKMRREAFGHRFNVQNNDTALRAINDTEGM